MLADYPFLLGLFAAIMAEGSAALLRRVAGTFGVWLYWLAGLLSSNAAFYLIWSYVWALGMREADQGAHSLVETLGVVVIFAGGSLLIWAIMTLGSETVLARPASRLVGHGPYRWVRRPMGIAVGMLGLGGALITGAQAVWVWLAAWLILSQPLFELEEWELGVRLYQAQGYLQRTPRYLPRRSP